MQEHFLLLSFPLFLWLTPITAFHLSRCCLCPISHPQWMFVFNNIFYWEPIDQTVRFEWCKRTRMLANTYRDCFYHDCVCNGRICMGHVPLWRWNWNACFDNEVDIWKRKAKLMHWTGWWTGQRLIILNVKSRAKIEPTLQKHNEKTILVILLERNLSNSTALSSHHRGHTCFQLAKVCFHMQNACPVAIAIDKMVSDSFQVIQN